jgi:hypothetical protein
MRSVVPAKKSPDPETRACQKGSASDYTPSCAFASLNQVRVVLIMDAGRTSPLVKVQSLSSCVALVEYLLLNLRGRAELILV